MFVSECKLADWTNQIDMMTVRRAILLAYHNVRCISCNKLVKTGRYVCKACETTISARECELCHSKAYIVRKRRNDAYTVYAHAEFYFVPLKWETVSCLYLKSENICEKHSVTIVLAL